MDARLPRPPTPHIPVPGTPVTCGIPGGAFTFSIGKQKLVLKGASLPTLVGSVRTFYFPGWILRKDLTNPYGGLAPTLTGPLPCTSVALPLHTQYRL